MKGFVWFGVFSPAEAAETVQGLWYAFGDFLEMLSMGAMKGSGNDLILNGYNVTSEMSKPLHSLTCDVIFETF